MNQAAALGYNSLTSRASSAGKLNSDTSITERVKDVSSRLIRQVGTFRPDAANWGWEVNVFDADEVNAFCAPGGKIGVYTGIVRRLELNDDELAAVLGHEIAHALREHSREKASQRELSGVIVQAIGAASRRNAQLNADLAALGSQLFVQLPFSREMESESDLMGLELMARAGYDPRQASNVWRKMASREGSSGRPEFLRTHPANETRMTQLEAAVPKVLALYTAGSSTAAIARAAPIQVAAVQGSPASTLTALPVTATPAVAPTRLRIGQDSFNVERLAMSRSCTPGAIAYMTDKGPGYESYAMNCGAVVLAYRCDFGNCRALQ
jgi:predicted Zn-dependent protease